MYFGYHYFIIIVIFIPNMNEVECEEDLKYYCGLDLGNALFQLCHGKFNTDPGSFGDRLKRGIVDECCSKPCRRSQLELYCQAPTTTTISLPDALTKSTNIPVHTTTIASTTASMENESSVATPTKTLSPEISAISNTSTPTKTTAVSKTNPSEVKVTFE
ncbi:hypothetical protein QAD02_006104 [Eretmocerus hayati]|uniref:Uncharacterized protein n=1 Tax=Eretmocerus hayati TaxID=131215 RepID=A0ACC2N067_9HYME|nr:hypothetical protein QAD02_006104 [Eretmocerus hayati]